MIARLRLCILSLLLVVSLLPLTLAVGPPAAQAAARAASRAAGRVNPKESSRGTPRPSPRAAPRRPVVARAAATSKCDLNQGRWVYDPKYKPAYGPVSCKSLRSYFNCLANGRKDRRYLNYVWRSPGCNIQRFNATSFMQRFRNKVFLVTGDSFATNFDASFRCLIGSYTKTKDFANKQWGNTGVKASGYFAKAFNFTVVRVPSNFLVASQPMGEVSSAGVWQVDLDKVDDNWAKLLPFTHYALFSSGHWFSQASDNLRKYRRGGRPIKPQSALLTMQESLVTLTRYLKASGYRGMPFFITYTAFHYYNSFAAKTESCVGFTDPFKPKQLQYAEATTDIITSRNAQMAILRRAPEFKIVDVARSTLSRPDAHQQMATGTDRPDCSHFCVPGVPDSWVDIVNSYMIGTI
ncbi:unnamed protein product [Closterium sp. Yama58-4]|nr:unnamed protein product [Closterium sp. Yama58-4]